jgi:hypothetical protein
MISRAVWLTPLLLLLCKGAAFCNEPTPILTIRSAPERPGGRARGTVQSLRVVGEQFHAAVVTNRGGERSWI